MDHSTANIMELSNGKITRVVLESTPAFPEQQQNLRMDESLMHNKEQNERFFLVQLSNRFGHRNFRVGSSVVQQPLIFKKGQSFYKAYVIDLPGNFKRFIRCNKPIVHAVQNFRRVSFVKNNLAGSIGARLQIFISERRTVFAVVDEKNSLFPNHCRWTRLNQFTVKFSFACGE